MAVLEEGDRGDCFYIILRGSVGVFQHPKDSGMHEETVFGNFLAKLMPGNFLPP